MLTCNNNQPAPRMDVTSFLPQILLAGRNASCYLSMKTHVDNMACSHPALVSRLLCAVLYHCSLMAQSQLLLSPHPP
jgi:hypothetical protein